MKTGRIRFVRGAVASAAVTVMLGWPTRTVAGIDAAAPAQAPSGVVEEAHGVAPQSPVLAQLAARPHRADAVLPIEVRITHPAGVGRAVLWFLGEHDTVFRPFPMRRLEGDVFTARLGVWKSRGSEVRYYVEAWDTTDTQRAGLGDRNVPFVVRLEAVPATVGFAVGRSALWIGILCAALLGVWWCGIRVRRRLPPPAPVREEAPAGQRVTPIVVRAAGSVAAQTVYLRLGDDISLAEAGLKRSVAVLRLLRSHGVTRRKSRLAYRSRPEGD